MLKNTDFQYGSLSKLFHWLVALLAIVMLLLGLSFAYLPDGPTKFNVVIVHETIGVILLVSMILRVIWRLFDPLPAMPAHVPTFQYILARASHTLLYLLLIAMPLSGMIMVTSHGHDVLFFKVLTFQVPYVTEGGIIKSLSEMAHFYFAWALFILILVHASAALLHHFYYKDRVLLRMLPGKR